jgi:hypothetical protein
MAMNRFYALAAAALVLLAVFGAGCRSFSGVRTPERKIAGEIEIGPEWREITVDPPLAVNEEIQFVGLQIEDLKERTGADRLRLVRRDGKELQIDAELIDQAGNPTALFPIGIGRLVEFGTGNRLPAQAAYGKIRIRSSEKISVKEIVWGDSSSW